MLVNVHHFPSDVAQRHLEVGAAGVFCLEQAALAGEFLMGSFVNGFNHDRPKLFNQWRIEESLETLFVVLFKNIVDLV